MITSKIPAANKKLRIYRPDISLQEICRTNGPAIVRKMIPCFEFLKEESDSTTPTIFFDNSKYPDNPKYPEYSFIYGVNVRTPRRINSILPFSTTYKYNKITCCGQLLDDFRFGEIKFKVPAFTEKYKIRELLLYAKIPNKGSVKIKDITILSLATECKLTDKELKNFKKDLCRLDGFFLMQVKALSIKEQAYMWLTSEDYNVNTGGEALSNIIAISDDYDGIMAIKPHKSEFMDLLFLIKARYLFDIEMEQRKTAIASAKAAIMSRNMSHNLGSHVMTYLKQHLNSVQDMIRDNVLASIFTSEENITTTEGLRKWWNRCGQIVESQNEGLTEVALPFLVGLGKFISYLQERQDFIATIATNYIPYLSTVNFKDFIYDELNPDLRYERHKDRIDLQPDNILLGNIARSEGLARETNPTIGKKMSNIVLKYRKFDGKAVYDEYGNPKSENEVKDIKEKIKDLEDLRDFMVHLPGGVVGRQAIFSIVENVIRNAAKHGKWGKGVNKNLELIFDRYYIEDIKNGTAVDYVPDGQDTLKKFLDKYYANAVDINDLCIVTLTDNMSFEIKGTKECKNLEAIRKALIEPYIDRDTVEMLQTNKGIKEMRISAAWMRGIEDDVKNHPLYITEDFEKRKNPDPEDFWIGLQPSYSSEKTSGKENEGFDYKYWSSDRKHWIGKAPVLMVRACATNEDEDYHLQYIFCLPKPKEVAIVLSEKTWSTWKCKKDIIQQLSKYSWNVFSVEDYLSTSNKSYEFIILDDTIDKMITDEIRMVSPNRVFKQKEIKDIIDLKKEVLNIDFSCLTRNYLRNIKIALFKKLCDFNPEEDIIFISDPKTKKRKSSLTHLPNKNIKIEDGHIKAKYLYRTHNETEIFFSEYLNKIKDYPEARFVEGITGNNSTDRLVRNENIDELWLYSHLHAMKTTIGVFDERIFSKIYKKDEADIVPRPFKELRLENYELLRSKDRKDDRLNEIKKAKTYEDLEKILKVNLTQTQGDYLAIAYERKGVSVFNIIKTKDSLDIYGFVGVKEVEEKVKDNKTYTKYYSLIEKLGEIREISGKIEIIKLKPIKKFDYITIHQGLLDKVYEQFGIRHDAYKKHLFTKCFYEAFCTNDSVINYKDDAIEEGDVYYLPHLRIHSGRSKPSFYDMPQHQPFMQYSAIEHAIMDCKYSLVELLDFARYE